MKIDLKRSRLIDWLNDYDWLFDWLIDWVNDYDWLIVCLFDWLSDWLIDWLLRRGTEVSNKEVYAPIEITPTKVTICKQSVNPLPHPQENHYKKC